MMFCQLIYTKLKKAAIMRQWNKDTAGLQNEGGAIFERYLFVLNFLSFRDEAYFTWMLKFTNQMQ
jgi:hypothetical protein